MLGWIGTPDTPRNTLASCCHDFLCQFRDTDRFPLSREQVDLVFREILERSHFTFAGVFWGAVADFGWLFKSPPDGSYSVLIPEDAGNAGADPGRAAGAGDCDRGRAGRDQMEASAVGGWVCCVKRER